MSPEEKESWKGETLIGSVRRIVGETEKRRCAFPDSFKREITLESLGEKVDVIIGDDDPIASCQRGSQRRSQANHLVPSRIKMRYEEPLNETDAFSGRYGRLDLPPGDFVNRGTVEFFRPGSASQSHFEEDKADEKETKASPGSRFVKESGNQQGTETAKGGIELASVLAGEDEEEGQGSEGKKEEDV